MAHPVYGSKWRRVVRPAILARDGYLCRIKGPKCTTIATTVDHIVPWRKDGAWWEPSNLRASCAACNYGRVDHRRVCDACGGSDKANIERDTPGTGTRPSRDW